MNIFWELVDADVPKRDPWEVLSLSPGATKDAIKQQYYYLSLILHPDVGGTRQAFEELNAAYHALTD